MIDNIIWQFVSLLLLLFLCFVNFGILAGFFVYVLIVMIVTLTVHFMNKY